MGTYIQLQFSQRSSDTFEVYYENRSWIPQVHWPPMEVGNIGTPRTLDRDRDDARATVEDICDFIVEYINSDHQQIVGIPTSHRE